MTYQTFDEDEGEQADAWTLAYPPDLVVEVEVTHFDKAKQIFYRDLGVSEYWHLERMPWVRCEKGKSVEVNTHSDTNHLMAIPWFNVEKEDFCQNLAAALLT